MRTFEDSGREQSNRSSVGKGRAKKDETGSLTFRSFSKMLLQTVHDVPNLPCVEGAFGGFSAETSARELLCRGRVSTIGNRIESVAAICGCRPPVLERAL